VFAVTTISTGAENIQILFNYCIHVSKLDIKNITVITWMCVVMNSLEVLVNNEIVLEFDRYFPIEDEQLTFLDRMDANMDRGIKIHGKLLVNPDSQQRATFVSMNLIKALQQGNEAVKTASCAYLINRHPKLIEVHANDHGNVIKIELIEDE